MSKAPDLANHTFGRLTALRPVKRGRRLYWECVCSCRRRVAVLSFCLTSGNTKSCGCANKLDLVGRKCGLLTVQSGAERKGGRKHYSCLCACGKAGVIVEGSKLKNGHTKSCGCVRKGAFRPHKRVMPEQAVFNRIIDDYRQNARAKKLEFSLAREEIIRLLTANCFYCGAVPTNTTKHKRYDVAVTHNGMDRLYRDQGYTGTNVVPCCWSCNDFKGAQDLDEFAQWLSLVRQRSVNTITPALNPPVNASRSLRNRVVSSYRRNAKELSINKCNNFRPPRLMA